MSETDAERRTRQAAIEQAARARLHGVEMPKRLDFTSKKKDADASHVLDTARAEEQVQTDIREVEKIRRDYNLGETKSAEELRQQKKALQQKVQDLQ